MPGVLSPKTKGARTYRTRMPPCAHPWGAADEVRLERQCFAVERPPGAPRSSGRLEGAVLIRLETDVGGWPKSLKSWRAGARGGSRKKIRANASSVARLLGFAGGILRRLFHKQGAPLRKSEVRMGKEIVANEFC